MTGGWTRTLSTHPGAITMTNYFHSMLFFLFFLNSYSVFFFLEKRVFPIPMFVNIPFSI